MEGLTIISQRAAMTLQWPLWAVILAFVIPVAMVITSMIIIERKNWDRSIVLLVMMVSFFIVFGLMRLTGYKIPSGETIYEVKATGKVDLNVFISKYEVLSVDGDVITIKDKIGDD